MSAWRYAFRGQDNMRPCGKIGPGAGRRLLQFPVWLLAFTFVAVTISSLAGQLTFLDIQGHRVADLEVPRNGHTGFSLMPPEMTGIRFTNVVPASRSLTNHILLNGSGVAAGDV